MHKSSHLLPRMGSESGSRILRVRADEDLLDMLQSPPGRSGGGAIEVPSREAVEPGERVRVEASFGPLADEILLSGVVNRIIGREPGQAPIVEILVVRTHAHRISYIQQVLHGQRIATSRRHRRTPADLPARWWWGVTPHAVKIKEFSRGGIFIDASRAPNIGFGFDVELRPDPRVPPLRIPARVVWTSKEQGHAGFGALFKIENLLLANKLASLVRGQEAAAPAW